MERVVRECMLTGDCCACRMDIDMECVSFEQGATRMNQVMTGIGNTKESREKRVGYVDNVQMPQLVKKGDETRTYQQNP